jgi:hypothetical protein
MDGLYWPGTRSVKWDVRPELMMTLRKMIVLFVEIFE